MTEMHEDTAAQPDQQQHDNADPADHQPEPAERELTPSRQAARYRTQLRAAEGERDALTARLERLQRAEVARMVGGRLAVAEDVFAFGLTLGDLVDEDGEVDDELVNTAVVGLLAQRPGLAVAEDRPKFPDLGGGKRGTSTATGPGWADLVRHPR